jgi:phosphoribosyl 1,2-cyclic phosphate phosphodiesterase
VKQPQEAERRTETLRLTVLGSGTSMGVPSLGCRCRVCRSTDPHDNRTRPSVLLSRDGRHAVIDTTPDFRQQALRMGLDRLDAVLLTHGHADHILGFDDIRPFNLRQKCALPVYASQETFNILRRTFSYVFNESPALSAIPQVTLHEVKGPFRVLDTEVAPVPARHGEIGVLGFRFGSAAYLTDFSELPASSRHLLMGLDDVILDALRDEPHPMHQTVEQALALVAELRPRRAWFTHIAHDLPHHETNERLRKAGHAHVQLAYDGMTLEVHV